MSVTVSWMGYALVVAALVSGGAVALERGARQLGWPARGVWVLALAASLLVPLVAGLRPPVTPESLLALPALSLPALGTGGAAPEAFRATSLLVILWAALSAGVFVLIVAAYAALQRSARGWRSAASADGEVWVSEDVGPAVVGVVRPRVVVPAWALELPAEARALLLLHEREHVRAGDARVVALAYLAAVALPWNPLVWWQIARLRHAIELDCDARVLARGGQARPYGALLLEVGRRRSGRPLLAAAFGERSTRLERRIRALVDHTRARRPLRGALFAVFGIALLGTAYCVRDPLAGNESPLADAVADPAGAGLAFTPMTQQPELQNLGDVQRALRASYPPLLKAAGIGGRATVWAFIAEDGRVTRSQLASTSGYAALDEAALDVLTVMRFTPARKEGLPVAVWIELPVVFSTDGGADAEAHRVVPAAEGVQQPGLPRKQAQPGAGVPAGVDTAGLPRRVGSQPSFTPMTQRPELVNLAEVHQALVESYPPLLRDGGIGGQVVVWFLIDETGVVRRTQVSRTSGRGELDEAALRVARQMRFTPAENRGTRVPVWVEIPILFQAK